MPASALVLSLASLLSAPLAPRQAALDEVSACTRLNDPSTRLACYDRAVAALRAAVDKGEVRVVDRQDLRQAKRSLFGLAIPRLGLFDREDKDDVEELETTIKSVRPLPGDLYRLTTADGEAVWETLEAPNRLIPPKVGQKLVLKRGAMGSFWIRINGQVGVKGRRVQ